ncbi:hypothetical protein DB88DRAFT_516824 [Papiliotrema laurentii]|uniref:Uncharacterized protein n=1 Tax=Papiliotrema laurentii TaxID=5418 RepID=A0AAD9LAB1_PAPLA|nr:hypothetical protein DB88DRAFT_516824 [Papiliotrema laurentii]
MRRHSRLQCGLISSGPKRPKPSRPPSETADTLVKHFLRGGGDGADTNALNAALSGFPPCSEGCLYSGPSATCARCHLESSLLELSSRGDTSLFYTKWSAPENVAGKRRTRRRAVAAPDTCGGPPNTALLSTYLVDADGQESSPLQAWSRFAAKRDNVSAKDLLTHALRKLSQRHCHVTRATTRDSGSTGTPEHCDVPREVIQALAKASNASSGWSVTGSEDVESLAEALLATSIVQRDRSPVTEDSFWLVRRDCVGDY